MLASRLCTIFNHSMNIQNRKQTVLTQNAQKPGLRDGKLSDFGFKSMLRLVVAINCFCTVVIMTGGTRRELPPTQLKLPNY